MNGWASAGIGAGLALALGPFLIPLLHQLRFGQTIRKVGPATHLQKQGTPTMGGILFLVPLLVAVMVIDPHSPSAWALVLLTLSYGLLGFSDDLLKVFFKRPLGLRAREKLFFQVLLAAAFVWYVDIHTGGHNDWILPFGGPVWNPGMWYGPLAVLAILGTSNAVNITDGLDGLAGGASIIALAFFAALGMVQHLSALTVVSLSLVGGLVGFLYYNRYPAKVFMGDTGSLALGAAIAGSAILAHSVLLLPIVGLLFVLETLSVILQVASFRLTGHRIFRMSPLHHHFELSGWPEQRVVWMFWLIALAGAMLAWWR